MHKKIGIVFSILIIVTAIIAIIGAISNISQKEENKTEKKETTRNSVNQTSAASINTINIKDTDGKKTNYIFEYNGETYNAIYTKDNWRIIDSYKIENKNDMAIICKALIGIYPIHGKDMESYRTVDDLVYEWEQHNIAYALLPDDNPWKKSVKDVDLDPKDQGKDMVEMYEDRTGKKFDLNNIK